MCQVVAGPSERLRGAVILWVLSHMRSAIMIRPARGHSISARRSLRFFMATTLGETDCAVEIFNSHAALVSKNAVFQGVSGGGTSTRRRLHANMDCRDAATDVSGVYQDR